MTHSEQIETLARLGMTDGKAYWIDDLDNATEIDQGLSGVDSDTRPLRELGCGRSAVVSHTKGRFDSDNDSRCNSGLSPLPTATK